MDPIEITMINDLGLSNDNYTIKVQIIRLWKQTTWSKPHETRKNVMILMDEEGNKIECTMDKTYVILGKALEEYVDVYIHKPTLGLYVDDVMKFVDSQNKLFFQYTTRVTKWIGFNGPLNSFAFANFQDLIDKAIPSTISFGKFITGRQVFATLWGNYAEQIDSYVSKHWGNFVMIIQCAKWKNHRGLMKKKVDRLLHALMLQRLPSCILGVMSPFLEQLRCLKIINNDTTQLARTVRERFKKCPLNNPMFWTVAENESGQVQRQDKCKEQVIVDEPRTLKLVNVVISDFNSQDKIGFKGSNSFVVDNTPIFTFPNTISMSPSTNHDTTSLLSPTTNVKCKLVDVYDLWILFVSHQQNLQKNPLESRKVLCPHNY
uniref:Replication protein A 70 kDa DNA-binding subunit B/D first OB fold domain-containing protein n=1 Tax=Lactuca sativa TaxID=4236 RepID=A0A9R1WUS5_LACSA|nr:hypothetical protein LSAT_V11C800443620 [Lactuca sativa]